MSQIQQKLCISLQSEDMAMVNELDADFRERDTAINAEGTDDMYGLNEHVSSFLSHAYNYDICDRA